MGHSLPAVALLAAVLASCSEASEPVRSLDLLARAPDRIVDQPGELDPSADSWADLANDGWESLAEDRAVAWAVARTASLRLPLLATEALPLELELRGPGKESRVTILVNDHELGEVRVGAEPSQHVLLLQSAYLRRGDNVLALRGSSTGEVATKQVYFGVSRVRYGHPLRVEPKPEGFALPAACSLAYRLELLADGALEVRGRATGDGRLVLRTRRLDPITGESDALEEESYPATDGRLQVDRPLPRDERVLELDLTWMSTDATSALELQRLAVHEF